MKVIFFLFTLLTVIHSQESKPQWVTSYGQDESINRNEYYIGFGVSSTASGISVALDEAKDFAKSDIAKNIYQKVKSVSLSSKKSEGVDLTQDNYSTVTSSESSIELSNLKSKEYVDNTEKKAFVLVYISKSELREFYKKKIDNNAKEILFLQESVVSFLQNDKKMNAIESLDKITSKLRALDTISSVVTHLYSNPAEMYDFDILSVKRFVQVKKDSLDNLSSTSIDELAYSICTDFSQTLTSKYANPKVQVTYFGYGSTKRATPYSKYLSSQVEEQLGNNFNCSIMNFSGKISEFAHYIIIGKYWVKTETLDFQISLFEVETGLVVAKSSKTIDIKTALKSKLIFLP